MRTRDYPDSRQHVPHGLQRPFGDEQAVQDLRQGDRPQDIRRDSPTAATWPLAARAMLVIVEFNVKIPRFSDGLDD
jgi:hypothetical protein